MLRVELRFQIYRIIFNDYKTYAILQWSRTHELGITSLDQSQLSLLKMRPHQACGLPAQISVSSERVARLQAKDGASLNLSPQSR